MSGEVVDQLGGGDEAGREAFLNGAIGDGDREVRFPTAGFADDDEGTAFRDKIGRQRRPQEREPHGGLVGEVEIVDRLEKREAGASAQSRAPGLLALGDLLGDEQREQMLVGRLLAFSALEEIPPDAAGVGEMEALEQAIEIDSGERRRRRPSGAGVRSDTSSPANCPSMCGHTLR